MTVGVHRAAAWPLAVVLTAMVTSCGGMASVRKRLGSAGGVSTRVTSVTQSSRAGDSGSITMTHTPPHALAVCREMRLMRAVCPRLVPRWIGTGAVSPLLLATCVGQGHEVPLTSGNCQQADWSLESSVAPSWAHGSRIETPGAPEEAGLIAPPWHVHVLISAVRGGWGYLWPYSWPTGRHRAADTLLTSHRTEPVSLGQVRWYAHSGQLVLAPLYPGGGELGGHLIFRFSTFGINYIVSLHAWLSRFRVIGRGTSRQVVLHRGSALPQVVATLKAIVRSALSG
jgi:hypothetical protein